MHVLAALLPSLVLADASAKIVDAGTALQDGQLIIEAPASEPVARDDVRTKLTARAWPSTSKARRSRAGAAASGRPASDGSACLPRSTYTKLQVPLAAGVACAGPVAVTLVENRVRASIACNATAAARGRRPGRPEQRGGPGGRLARAPRDRRPAHRRSGCPRCGPAPRRPNRPRPRR